MPHTNFCIWKTWQGLVSRPTHSGTTSHWFAPNDCFEHNSRFIHLFQGLIENVSISLMLPTIIHFFPIGIYLFQMSSVGSFCLSLASFFPILGQRRTPRRNTFLGSERQSWSTDASLCWPSLEPSASKLSVWNPWFSQGFVGVIAINHG